MMQLACDLCHDRFRQPTNSHKLQTSATQTAESSTRNRCFCLAICCVSRSYAKHSPGSLFGCRIAPSKAVGLGFDVQVLGGLAMKALKGILAGGLLLLVLGFASSAKADPVTDTGLNVIYTATSTFVAGSGNVFDVFLTVDASAFNNGPGSLNAVSMQFKTGSDVASSVTLLAAPGGTSAWSFMIGGISAGGCNGTGGSSGSVCFQT